MTKVLKQSTVTVRDSKTGQFVTVRGVGALKGQALDLRKGVDLTKPIASQTLDKKQK
ncbi:hypothetical protein [Rhizobium sp. BG4]|jgi:hypothetical protein|uniref:hypothetical protein n=1 Tax=Rhizobium sp. BG4 TaxID=2613770 RepID=UPI00193E6B30|nr:hypothetical protein [Rhizobium sp. BG4]